MKRRPKYTSFDTLHKEWMKNPKFRSAYEDLQPEFEIAGAIFDARINKKISQAELAKRIGTGQAVISRLETAVASPSLSLIKRVADALGFKAEIRFIPK